MTPERFHTGRLLITGLLAIATLLLLFANLSFFSSAAVWDQLGVWAGDHIRLVSWASGPPPAVVIEQGTVSQPVITGWEPLDHAVPLPEAGSRPIEAAPVAEQPAPAPQPQFLGGELIIRSLELHHSIQPVALTHGVWDISDLENSIGWLESTGVQPKGDLAMVFVGHYTLPSPSRPGPFKELKTLQPGDEVVYRTAERIYTYKVELRTSVGPDEVDNLFLQDGNKIILVTCTEWNYLTRQYEQRLLIQANLVAVETVSTRVN